MGSMEENDENQATPHARLNRAWSAIAWVLLLFLFVFVAIPSCGDVLFGVLRR